MNNRVCLHPDIKWHGVPKVQKLERGSGVRVEKVDGALIVTVTVGPKRMSRKRLVKLLMAHGMMARSARSFAEMRTRDGWPHFVTYKFVVEKMHEFIDVKNKAGENADGDGLPMRS